ncbi:MAG: LysR family transcriptional regulator [Bdellovibrionales bacterium]|nr:LysR family transcriptional regulator [Bdellovibrionales bacterium]
MRRLKDINWNQFYYFFEVAKHGSMKKAASNLKVTSATLSEQIKNLEEVLKVKLFKRSPRKLTLTEEGRSLYFYADQMFQFGFKILDTVSPVSVGGYQVKISIPNGYTKSLHSQLLQNFAKAYMPFGTVNVSAHLSHDELEYKLLQGELDWGFSSQEPRSKELGYRYLGMSDFYFYCSQKVDAIQNQELQLPLTLHPLDKDLNLEILKLFESKSIRCEEISYIESKQMAIDLCLKKLAVLGLTGLDIKTLGLKKHLKLISPQLKTQLNHYVIWKKSQRKMVSTQKLIQVLDQLRTN